MNNIFKLYIILSTIFIFSSENIKSQACTGTPAQSTQIRLSIQNAEQTAPNKFTFEVYIENLNLLLTQRISAIAGNLKAVPETSFGTGYSAVVLEQPSSQGLTLNNMTPNVAQTLNFRWTMNPNASSTFMLTSETKIGTFEVTLGTGGVMPSEINLVSNSPTAITTYCSGNPNSAAVTTSTGLIIGSNAPLTPLPIKISSLEAFQSGKNNTINWSTASEVNNQFQIVETSLDGSSNWSEVGRVNAKNSASGASYQVIDHKPSGLNYYRIRSIDFDGKVEFSKIVSVQREGRGGNINAIHPNPTANFVQIDLQTDYDADVNYNIMDATGKLLKSVTHHSAQGNVNTHTLDMSDLQNGLYIVSIQGGGINQNTKIFKN